jgi:hypothetical protein
MTMFKGTGRKRGEPGGPALAPVDLCCRRKQRGTRARGRAGSPGSDAVLSGGPADLRRRERALFLRICETLSRIGAHRHLAIEDKAAPWGAITALWASSLESPAMAHDATLRPVGLRGKGRSFPAPAGGPALTRGCDAMLLAAAARSAVVEDRIALREASSAAVAAAVPLGLRPSHGAENSDPRRSDRRGSAAFWGADGPPEDLSTCREHSIQPWGAALWSGFASFCWSPGQSQSWV